MRDIIRFHETHAQQPKAGSPTGLFTTRDGIDEPVGIVWQVGKLEPTKPQNAAETVARLEAGKVSIIVVKMPGHHYWSGRGQQRYAPAEFHVFHIEDVERIGSATSAIVADAELLAEFPTR